MKPLGIKLVSVKVFKNILIIAETGREGKRHLSFPGFW
jgi:hypothetical protein